MNTWLRDRRRCFSGRRFPTSALRNYLTNSLHTRRLRDRNETETRVIGADEDDVTGFVFKIQANMDPGHRDRIAFMRICSGEFQKGMKLKHIRSGKDMKIADAITFMAADRQQTETAYSGDIIGLHNHGTINIGDSFSQGEDIRFVGIPNFAPEIFRRAVLKDPLRMKALQKGLAQLCEEGATQLFQTGAKQRSDTRCGRAASI